MCRSATKTSYTFYNSNLFIYSKHEPSAGAHFFFLFVHIFKHILASLSIGFYLFGFFLTGEKATICATTTVKSTHFWALFLCSCRRMVCWTHRMKHLYDELRKKQQRNREWKRGRGMNGRRFYHAMFIFVYSV